MIRGDIWWIDFGEPFGSEPAFRRPAVIVQNNDFNKSDMNTTIVIPLTTNLRLADFPDHRSDLCDPFHDFRVVPASSCRDIHDSGFLYRPFPDLRPF